MDQPRGLDLIVNNNKSSYEVILSIIYFFSYNFGPSDLLNCQQAFIKKKLRYKNTDRWPFSFSTRPWRRGLHRRPPMQARSDGPGSNLSWARATDKSLIRKTTPLCHSANQPMTRRDKLFLFHFWAMKVIGVCMCLCRHERCTAMQTACSFIRHVTMVTGNTELNIMLFPHLVASGNIAYTFKCYQNRTGHTISSLCKRIGPDTTHITITIWFSKEHQKSLLGTHSHTSFLVK